jgi:hypothetical protein
MRLHTRVEKLEQRMGTRNAAGRCFSVCGMSYTAADVTAFLASQGIEEQPDDFIICIRGIPAPKTDDWPMSLTWLGPAPSAARGSGTVPSDNSVRELPQGTP